MANLVKVGQPIPLSLQLSDEDSGLFPQAVLRDAGGSLVATVDLPHVAGGLYQDTSEVMPATNRVFAQYKVYSDAGHATQSLVHCDTLLNVFERDFVGEKVDAIFTSLQAFSGNLESIEGFVLDDDSELSGTIDDSGSLSGTIKDDDSLSGIIEELVLTGQLHDEGQATGVIEC